MIHLTNNMKTKFSKNLLLLLFFSLVLKMLEKILILNNGYLYVLDYTLKSLLI